MRRFRFIGNPKEYSWKNPPVYLKVYDFNEFEKDYGFGAELDIFNVFQHSKDWQEVFEEPIKPLHKDTDLGYFAGLVFKACFNDLKNGDWSNENIAIHSIEAAKELIKQLDAESK